MSEETKLPDVPTNTVTWTLEHSSDIGELFGALAKAQLEFKPIFKDTENPYYKSKYADLSQCIAATQPALAKNGIAIVQFPNADCAMKTMSLVSIMGHSSGQWMRGTLTLPAEMTGRDSRMRFDSQSVGAAMTYGRRYSYQCLTGTAAEQDDDANAALGIGTREAAQEAGKRVIEKTKAKMKNNQTGPIGVVRISYKDEDPEIAYLTPSWLLTDKDDIKEHLRPFEDVMKSFDAKFIPNGKCYTVRRSVYFDVTDKLSALGWNCLPEAE